jgi:hypothetical protein
VIDLPMGVVSCADLLRGKRGSHADTATSRRKLELPDAPEVIASTFKLTKAELRDYWWNWVEVRRSPKPLA